MLKMGTVSGEVYEMNQKINMADFFINMQLISYLSRFYTFSNHIQFIINKIATIINYPNNMSYHSSPIRTMDQFKTANNDLAL